MSVCTGCEIAVTEVNRCSNSIPEVLSCQNCCDCVGDGNFHSGDELAAKQIILSLGDTLTLQTTLSSIAQHQMDCDQCGMCNALVSSEGTNGIKIMQKIVLHPGCDAELLDHILNFMNSWDRLEYMTILALRMTVPNIPEGWLDEVISLTWDRALVESVYFSLREVQQASAEKIEAFESINDDLPVI